MASILKLIRVVFYYTVFFSICVVVIAIALQGWSDGAQMLFAFGLPAFLVWRQERKRSQKAADQPDYDLEETVQSRFDEDQNDRSGNLGRSKLRKSTNGLERKATLSAKPQELPTIEDTAIVQVVRPKAPTLSPFAKGHQNTKAQKKNARSKGWVSASETTNVAGRDIGGLVYVGTPPVWNDHGYREKCKAYIDPSLSVARKGGDTSGEGMPYWPGYSEIPARNRATYLDWLASGRSDASYDPGYMFLYFYGLERRFFVDQSDVDAKDIVAEVRRLASLYPENHSVKRYLGEFLDISMLAEPDVASLKPTYENQGWELPFSLRYAIGGQLEQGKKLDADWILSWWICHPESQLRTPAKRCREEFLALFKLRFNERFVDGLKVNKPRKSLEAIYCAASREFERKFNPKINGKPVPDIATLRKPVEIAQEIADEVMDDLDKLSRYLGRNPDSRNSIEAQALLPLQLWQLFPSSEIDQLKDWADRIIQKGGHAPLVDVIEKLEGTRTPKIGKRQLTSAADALARLGFGLAPDPRYALRSPKPNEPVVLFNLGQQVERLEDVSDNYQAALMELALASFVVHADGHVVDAEKRMLEAQVAAIADLSEQESRRLSANLVWFLAVPPDMSLLRRKLKDVDVGVQTTMRAALVGAAHADGVIRSEEVASIEKVYKALGLDPALAYSDLHAGEVPDAPRTVRSAQPGRSGETIPQVAQATGPVLDASRIAAIRSDTARVSSVLGQIFEVGEEPELEKEEIKSTLFGGLDKKHSALILELIAQTHWTEDAFDRLCTQQGLMASGALETVNEWAFEAYDEALLDEYEGYDVSEEIIQAVQQKLKEERQHG